MNEQIQKVAELTTDNEEIKSQSIEQKNTIKTLLNENQQMRIEINNQDKKINDLLNENQQMKIQIDELKKQLIKKPFDSSSVERKSIFFGENPHLKMSFIVFSCTDNGIESAIIEVKSEFLSILSSIKKLFFILSIFRTLYKWY